MDVLRCRFLGVADGDVGVSVSVAAGGVEAAGDEVANGSVAAGDGLTGGESNGGLVGMGPLFWGFRTVKEGGMEL